MPNTVTDSWVMVMVTINDKNTVMVTFIVHCDELCDGMIVSGTVIVT